MKNSKHIGKIGEDIATDFLIHKSYKIIARNWRFSRAEIDIIAKHEGILVFVEVKTRSSNFFGQPEDFISLNQQRLIADAASQYMSKNHYGWAFRFDIISILVQKNQEKIVNHFEDAFFPGLEGL